MGMLSGFLALMVSGVPVAIAMAFASLVYVMVSGTACTAASIRSRCSRCRSSSGPET
jgi:hypothetical protein